MSAAVVSPAELVRSAFEMLLERIEEPGSEPRHVLSSPAITLGATTGRVPTPAASRSRRA
jgi:DNA-binding LacI/PurR family transcriptional regulator